MYQHTKVETKQQNSQERNVLLGLLVFLTINQLFLSDEVEEIGAEVSFGSSDVDDKTADKVWLINEPDACKEVRYNCQIFHITLLSCSYSIFQEPELLLGVAAAVYAFERREIIRQTWGTYAESENVKVLFFQTGVRF